MVSILMIDLLFLLNWNEATFGNDTLLFHYNFTGKIFFLKALDFVVSDFFFPNKGVE